MSDDVPAQPSFVFAVNQPVKKKTGYRFDGFVRAAFFIPTGERYVVESESAPGLLHIFSDEQLAPRDLPELKVKQEATKSYSPSNKS